MNDFKNAVINHFHGDVGYFYETFDGLFNNEKVMNQRTEKYLALYDNFELKFLNESSYYQQLDLLWDSFSNEEILWIEEQLKKRKIPQAPKDLGLVDQVVPMGSSVLPRVKSKDGNG